MDDDGVLRGVGPRLRQLRLEREATLTDLAEETGISVSTLSRLESGQRKPTLELLLPLARAHRVALDELVDAPETGDPRIRSKPVVRHGRTFISLTRRPGGLQSFKMLLPVDNTPPPTLQTHEGYEWLYVLSGKVRLMLGNKDLTLEPGEVVEFDTRTPALGRQPRPGARRGAGDLRPAGRADARPLLRGGPRARAVARWTHDDPHRHDVKWKWGSSWAEGKVTEVHHGDVSRTTKGSEITRHGSDDDPAYVIEQEDGTTVLKLASEVERA